MSTPYIVVELTNLFAYKRFLSVCEAIRYDIYRHYQNNYYVGIGGSKIGHVNFYSEHAEKLLSMIEEFEPAVILQMKKMLGATEYELTVNINVNLPGSYDQFVHSDTTVSDDICILNFSDEEISEKNGAINIWNKSHATSKSFLFGLKKNQVNLKIGQGLLRLGSLPHNGTRNATRLPRIMTAIVMKPKRLSVKNDTRNWDRQSGFYNNFFNASDGRELLLRYVPMANQLYQLFRILRRK